MAEAALPDMRAIVGSHDVVLLTLDTLRFDAAQCCFERGELPVLSAHLPAAGWERRHTPASFTFAAHAAFFAGFILGRLFPGARFVPAVLALLTVAFAAMRIAAMTCGTEDSRKIEMVFRSASQKLGCSMTDVKFSNPTKSPCPLSRFHSWRETYPV